jgi:hypothetical protein
MFAPKIHRITKVEPMFVSPYNANTLLSAAPLLAGVLVSAVRWQKPHSFASVALCVGLVRLANVCGFVCGNNFHFLLVYLKFVRKFVRVR